MSEHLERVDPDLLRSMFKMFVEALMGARADAVCGAPYGARSSERTDSRTATGSGTGHPCWHHGGRDPQAAGGVVLPGLVLPAFEHYTLREITVRKVDQFIKTRAATRRYTMAKQARTVLSLAFWFGRSLRRAQLPVSGGTSLEHVSAWWQT